MSPENYRCMEAMLLHSGYAPVPWRHMLWEDKPDCCNQLVSDSIRYVLYCRYKKLCKHFITVLWIHIQLNLNPDPDPAKNLILKTLNMDPNYKKHYLKINNVNLFHKNTFFLRRDDLEGVLKCLHFCDNSDLNEDGFFKVILVFCNKKRKKTLSQNF